MERIAVFLKDGALGDFFGANMFRVYSKADGEWKQERDTPFEPIAATSPAMMRGSVERLLPLIADCSVIAGGTLLGIPFLTFNVAGLHIFEIKETSGALFDEMMNDVRSSEAERRRLDGAVRDARPAETQIPGVYVLDLVGLQTEFPAVSSKQAMSEFLENTLFTELRLLCGHVPPWIKNGGKYDIQSTNKPDGSVLAIITRKR
ncbi:MAG: hypothetical protein LBT12_03270 [Oscillospiraceae bacterium]|jgi:hypothetical protein|nr:hypothetical protein [Oscillospiraceae bacterium]